MGLWAYSSWEEGFICYNALVLRKIKVISGQETWTLRKHGFYKPEWFFFYIKYEQIASTLQVLLNTLCWVCGNEAVPWEKKMYLYMLRQAFLYKSKVSLYPYKVYFIRERKIIKYIYIWHKTKMAKYHCKRVRRSEHKKKREIPGQTLLMAIILNIFL